MPDLYVIPLRKGEKRVCTPVGQGCDMHSSCTIAAKCTRTNARRGRKQAGGEGDKNDSSSAHGPGKVSDRWNEGVITQCLSVLVYSVSGTFIMQAKS